VSSNKIKDKNANLERRTAHREPLSKPPQPFDKQTLAQYETILNFLEDVYQTVAPYKYQGAEKESQRDVLILNFTKVVSDCRAILLLSKHGFYIQAGIIARSTSDACHLMVHLAFAENPSQILSEWLQGTKVTHWTLVRNIQQQVNGQLNLDAYASERSRLDNFVHGNYEVIRLYPGQVGAARKTDTEWRDITSWHGLSYLFLYSCLMVVDLVSTKLAPKSDKYMKALIRNRVDQKAGGDG
jgi:archaellum component FlaG (FlaF/FlaG flagellin family)